MTSGYKSTPAQQAASDYFNSLPQDQRAKLAPLLDWYRQAGLAEAAEHLGAAQRKISERILGIRNG